MLLAGGETQAITGNVVAVFTQTEALKSSKHYRQLVRAQMSLPVHSDRKKDRKCRGASALGVLDIYTS